MTCLGFQGKEYDHVNYKCLTCNDNEDKYICVNCVHRCHIGHELVMFPNDTKRVCTCCQNESCKFYYTAKDQAVYEINGEVKFGPEVDELVKAQVQKAQAGDGKMKIYSDTNVKIKTEGFVIKTRFANNPDADLHLKGACRNNFEGNCPSYHAYRCLDCMGVDDFVCSQCIQDHIGHKIVYLGRKAANRCMCKSLKCSHCIIPTECSSKDGEKSQVCWECQTCGVKICEYCAKRFHNAHRIVQIPNETFECKDPKTDCVLVEYIEAADLPKADLIGKSDPYCVSVIEPESDRAGDFKENRTRYIDNTFDPVWNERGHLSFKESPETAIKVTVFDQDDISKHDLLSSTQIPLKDLPLGEFVDDWYELTPGKGFKKGGRIHLRIMRLLGMPIPKASE